jgi:methyl coenzyme M reductase alpha subunit
VTEQLLEIAGARAEQLGKPIDELYAEAIDRYIEVTKHARPGSVRSRHLMLRTSPRITIEIPDELFQRAEEHAARLEKRRDIMYTEALAKLVARDVPTDSALKEGHDLPSGAWRAKGPAPTQL